MMAFGAKIKLSVNTSGASAFRSEIQKYVTTATKDNPIKLKHFAVSITKEDQRKIIRDLQTYLSGDNTLTLKIGKIDANGAVAKLRQQLQTMLSGLSITGLKEFLGETNIDKITEEIDNAKQAASQWAAQMRVVDDISKTLGSTYKTALSGGQMLGDATQVSEITAKYTAWQIKVEELRNTKIALSAEEIQNLQQEGIAIQQKISLIQEEQAATVSAAKQDEIDARKKLQLAQQQVSLKSQVQRYILSNSKAYKEYGSELDGIMQVLQSEAHLTDEEMKQIRIRLYEIQRAAIATGKSGNTFFDTLKKGWEKFGGWSLVTKSMMTVIRLFKDMISAVKKLDAAMTELKKVTDLSEQSYQKYLVTAQKMSVAIGATLADTVNATADFARLGYNLADSTALAEAALVYKNVGDGIENIGEASESLISTIKAFEQLGESADNAMSIVDRFNEVGNNFAISSQGIGEALRRSASALAAAGNSLNESIALVTGMNTVVQDPDSVGTALKTISMYLRAAKTEAEDAGESTEGMANSVSELRKELLTLTKGKVDIMIDDKTFKSTYKIMRDLSKVWKGLADIDRANIIELIGGKRNANAITSLLTNFEDAEKALQTAAQASGSALAENEKYLDSIAGRISILQSKFETFSSNLIESGAVKFVVDLGSVLLDTLNFLNPILPLITGISTALILTSKQGSTTVRDVTNQVMLQKTALAEEKTVSDSLKVSLLGLTNAEQRNLVVQLQRKVVSGEITEEQYKQIISTLGLSAAEKGLVAADGTLIVANKGLASSFKSLAASIPVWGWIALGVSFILEFATMIDGLIGKFETSEQKVLRLNEEIQELQKNIQSISSEFKSKAKTISEVSKRFAELSQGVDALTGKNVSLSTDDYNEFLDLSNQIADLFPTLSRNYDENGNAIVTLSGDVDTICGSLKNLLELERQLTNQKIVDNLPSLYERVIAKSKISNSIVDELKSKKDDLELLINSEDDKFSIDGNILHLKKIQGESIDQFDAYNEAVKTLLEKTLKLNFQALYPDYSTDKYGNEVIEQYSYSIDDLNLMDENEYNEAVEKLKVGLLEIDNDLSQEIRDIVQDISAEEAKNDSNWSFLAQSIATWLSTEDSYKILSDSAQALVQKAINNLDFSELNFDEWKDAKKYIIDNVVSLFSGANGASIQSAAESLYSALTSFSNGNMSFDEYKNAIAAFKESISGYLSKDQKDVLQWLFGIKFDSDETEYDTLVKGVQDKVSADAKDKIGGLSLDDLKIAYDVLKANKGTLLSFEELVKEIEKAKKAAQSTLSNVDILTKVESLSDGFEKLSKIYDDIKNKGDFDFGSVLNNNDFKTAFGKLESYEKFIETVTKYPDDIEACQSAFDNLVGEYIAASGALDKVTEATRDATVAFLKQNGITNAAAVVDRVLAIQKEKLRIETELGTDATYDEIKAQFDSAEAGSILQTALAQLALAKLKLNNTKINTERDIDNIIAMANAAGASAKTMAQLKNIKDSFNSNGFSRSTKNGTNGTINAIDFNGNVGKNSSNNHISSLNDVDFTFNPFDASDFYAGSSGSSSTSSEPKQIDWIETAIKRVERLVERFKNTMSSAFKTIETRLKSGRNAIREIYREIDVQQRGYDKYMQAANAVGLSESLAEKVRSGAISISEYDSNTQKLISDYQDFYEKALSCKDAIDDLHESIVSLYQENFNNAKSDFENQLGLTDHLKTIYDSGADLLEARGYLESTKYYSALQDVEAERVDTLNKELIELKERFSEAMNSGEIAENSEAWYSMQDAINSVKESLAESNVTLAEYINKMREIKDSYFDFVQDRISQITQESNFLLDLLGEEKLFTDNGEVTLLGKAAFGLHTQNYNVYMAQADKYAAEILKYNKEIANDPYNTKLIERREELLKLQQEAISSAEDEKNAIVDLVKNGIEKQLESIKKLIDAYTESLDNAKNLYEYQKKVTEQSEKIASLKKQLSAYANDTSEETRSKIQKLQVELKSAQEELQESQYDRYVSDQRKLLDELYTEYETALNRRLDDIDVLIGNVVDAVNNSASGINQTLIETAERVGYTLSDQMKEIWGNTADMEGVVSKYGDMFDARVTTINSVLDSIQAYVANIANKGDKDITIIIDNATKTTTPDPSVSPVDKAKSDISSGDDKTGGGTNGTGKKKNPVMGGDSYPSDSGTKPGRGTNQIAFGEGYTILREMGDRMKVQYPDGRTEWITKYASGGLVNYTGLAQVDGTPSKPELMLNAEDTQNFLALRDVLRKSASQPLLDSKSIDVQSMMFNGITDMADHIRKLAQSSSGMSASREYNVTFGDIKIDHVEDYNDFVRQLQKDSQFEKMVQAMTIDQVVGRSTLAKHKFKW